MKKFRLFALLLALLMLAGVLAGCNPGGEAKSTTPRPWDKLQSPRWYDRSNDARDCQNERL